MSSLRVEDNHPDYKFQVGLCTTKLYSEVCMQVRSEERGKHRFAVPPSRSKCVGMKGECVGTLEYPPPFIQFLLAGVSAREKKYQALQ